MDILRPLFERTFIDIRETHIRRRINQFEVKLDCMFDIDALHLLEAQWADEGFSVRAKQLIAARIERLIRLRRPTTVVPRVFFDR